MGEEAEHASCWIWRKSEEECWMARGRWAMRWPLTASPPTGECCGWGPKHSVKDVHHLTTSAPGQRLQLPAKAAEEGTHRCIQQAPFISNSTLKVPLQVNIFVLMRSKWTPLSWPYFTSQLHNKQVKMSIKYGNMVSPPIHHMLPYGHSTLTS